MEESRLKCMNDLTMAFILKEFSDRNPMGCCATSISERERMAIDLYRNDIVFNRRVKSMVASTMFIVDKHVVGWKE